MNRNEAGSLREVVSFTDSVGRFGCTGRRKLAIVDVVDAPSMVRLGPLGALASRKEKRHNGWPVRPTISLDAGFTKAPLLLLRAFVVLLAVLAGRAGHKWEFVQLRPTNEEILLCPYAIDDVEDVVTCAIAKLLDHQITVFWPTSGRSGVPLLVVARGGWLGWADFDELAFGARRGHGNAILPQALNAEVDGLADKLQNFVPCLAHSRAAREIWDVSPPSSSLRARLPPHNAFRVPHFFRPACLRMALSVPGGTSTTAFPATVTVAGLPRCLNCLWLPVSTASGSDQRRNASVSDGWTAQMPVGCLLVGVADVENTGFVPHAADDLQADRQACLGEAAGDRE